MKKEEYEPLIRETLKDFDFSTVHAFMKATNWEWSPGNEAPHIPTIGELYQCAERLLVEAAQKEHQISSGGFSAYSDGTSVEICFTIAESGCTKNELDIFNAEDYLVACHVVR